MSTKIDYNVWCKWDPLKTVLIGSCVSPEYFSHVANIEIREKLQNIVSETAEDLDNLAKTCTDHGVKVLRTDPLSAGMAKFLHPDKPAQSIKSVLYPRDHLAVLGNTIVCSKPEIIAHKNYPEAINEDQMHKDTAWHQMHFKYIKGGISPPSWTLVGKDLFVDTFDYTHRKNDHNFVFNKSQAEDWSKRWLPGIDLHWLNIGGHNDGCFHTIKPGVIISLEDTQKYEQTFPGWEVLYLPDQSWNLVSDFLTIKSETQGKYWIPGQSTNKQLLNFINTWLNEWLGYVEETVFDVNCLMLNESTVLVNNYNKKVFDFFKRHKVEPIICPLRHRFFFDGGIHCVTLDLDRDGQCQSYIDYK